MQSEEFSSYSSPEGSTEWSEQVNHMIFVTKGPSWTMDRWDYSSSVGRKGSQSRGPCGIAVGRSDGADWKCILVLESTR